MTWMEEEFSRLGGGTQRRSVLWYGWEAAWNHLVKIHIRYDATVLQDLL